MIRYYSEINEIEFILKNLRDEDREELENLYGDVWYEKTLYSLKDEKFLVLYGQGESNQREPVAIGGFYDIPDDNCKMACVWLLSTKYVNKNKTALIRVLRNELYNNSLKYDILYNFIYKSNYEAKRWLTKLGFSFDNPNPDGIKLNDGFEFFYKRIRRN